MSHTLVLVSLQSRPATPPCRLAETQTNNPSRHQPLSTVLPGMASIVCFHSSIKRRFFSPSPPLWRTLSHDFTTHKAILMGPRTRGFHICTNKQMVQQGHGPCTRLPAHLDYLQLCRVLAFWSVHPQLLLAHLLFYLSIQRRLQRRCIRISQLHVGYRSFMARSPF